MSFGKSNHFYVVCPFFINAFTYKIPSSLQTAIFPQRITPDPGAQSSDSTRASKEQSSSFPLLLFCTKTLYLCIKERKRNITS